MVFLYFFVVLCNSTPFSPIQAGTFYITAKDLAGASRKIIKVVQLETPWQIYNQNLNIDIVCAFSFVDIDERASFQFIYKLADKVTTQSSQQGKRKKIILIQITDKKGFIYKQLKIGVDFLIAQNLRTSSYNLTDSQQHVMNQSLTEDQADASNKQVHNQLFLFPNGFSSFNLTHNVMYSYATTPYDMYTINYMTGMGHQHKEQGWISGEDFIYFRYVLYPKYPYGYRQCGAVYQTQLQDDFYFQCDKKGVDGYFYGLVGYEGARFQGQFKASRSGFTFQVSHINYGKKYNVIGFPFKLNKKFNFIDNRFHSYDYFQEKNYLSRLFITLGIIVITIVIGVIMKNRQILTFDLQQQKQKPSQSQPSLSSYNTGSKGNSTIKSRNYSIPHQETYDQQVEQQWLHQPSAFNKQQGPEDTVVYEDYCIQ